MSLAKNTHTIHIGVKMSGASLAPGIFFVV